MKKPNFQQLYEFVYITAKEVIENFASSKSNKNVYALAFDLNEDYGDIFISVNTEQGLKNTINNKYPDYTEDQIEGLNGLKYSAGDFTFFDLCDFPKEFDEWKSNYNGYLFSLKSDESYINNTEKFSNTISKVINDLNQTITQLDRTDDFIAYHCFHDVDEDTDIRLILKTISQDQFDKVFPKYKELSLLINNIDALTKDSRLKIWMNMLSAYFNYDDSKYYKQFFQQNTYLDIAPQLEKLGADAIDSIFKMLDSIIFSPELNNKGSKEWEELGAFSRTANVTHLLLGVIASVGNKNTNVENKLLDYIANLQIQTDQKEGTIGLNLCLTARCLHYLNDKYPPDEMCPNSNRLLNYNQYIKMKTTP